MNGRYVFDTNFIIYAINNGLILKNADYAISIITEMELLSFSKLLPSEESAIKKLLSNFEIVNIDTKVKNKAIEIRKHYGLKLPDSIICATAFSKNAVLVTDDKRLQNINELKLISIEDFI